MEVMRRPLTENCATHPTWAVRRIQIEGGRSGTSVPRLFSGFFYVAAICPKSPRCIPSMTTIGVHVQSGRGVKSDGAQTDRHPWMDPKY